MIEPGRLLATGRAADVFDQGDGSVLRRYRTDHDTEAEARLMRWLRDAGYPVPVVRHATGGDLVMDRIPGPTMIEDLENKPHLLGRHMKTLADLQARLNALDPPDWVEAGSGIPDGSSVLHLDLHPMNVIMSPGGPVVIDWTNARRGDADFDAALSYLLMAAYEVSGLKDALAKRLVVGLFRRHRGADAIRRRLPEAAEFRLQDANITEGERAAIKPFLRP